MKIGQSSFVYFISTIIASILGFIGTIYFSNVLGAEKLGVYFLILSVTTWVSIFTQVGIPTAVKKRLSEGKQDSFVYSAATLELLLFMLASVVLLIFSTQINEYIGFNATNYIIMITFTINTFALVSYVLDGRNRVHISGLLKPINGSLRVLLQGITIFIGFGISGLVFGYVGGALIATVAGLHFISIEYQPPKLGEVISIYHYAKYAWASGFRSRAFSYVDIAVLGFFVSPNLIGIYQVAWLIGSFFGMAGSSISRVIFPVLSKLSAEESYDEIGNIITISLSFSGILLVPGLIGSLLLGDLVLSIYGDEFVKGATIFTILIVAHLFYTYQRQLTNSLNAIDRPDITLRINVVFIATNIVLNIILVSYFGWAGAAVATVLSTSLGMLLGYQELSKIVNIPIRRPIREFINQIAAAAIMGIVVQILKYILRDSLIVLGALISVGAVVYFTSLLLISNQFRLSVIDNIPAPEKLPLLR